MIINILCYVLNFSIQLLQCIIYYTVLMTVPLMRQNISCLLIGMQVHLQYAY